MKEIQFSDEAKHAIDLIRNSSVNVFVTGKAGTGKSTLLEHVRNNANSKTIVLAPTGVAAININGETIHSFFGLKPGFELDEARETPLYEQKIKKYENIHTIMIDEISMVRADLLDAIDVFLRRVRKNSKPFGGVQMVFFGDLYQLPPVVTPTDREQFFSLYEAPYFFYANVFDGVLDLFSSSFEMRTVELNHVYRQSNAEFIDLLNAVRNKTLKHRDLETLNSRCDPYFIPADSDSYIHLVTTNANAARINGVKLAEITGPEHRFSASSSGEIAKNLRPNDEEIVLKVGAQVMFIYNDPERKWVNGTIGKIVDIKSKYDEELGEMEQIVLVEKTDRKIVEVGPYTWEISKYEFEGGVFTRKQIGSFTQIPLKLAWAITIHKSQGKTFGKVILDLGRGSFAHGQSYVALSRCTSMEGLVLRRPFRYSDVILDRQIEEFCQ